VFDPVLGVSWKIAKQAPTRFLEMLFDVILSEGQIWYINAQGLVVCDFDGPLGGEGCKQNQAQLLAE
jgi:hypothetical protein